jgi:hypothetical protein
MPAEPIGSQALGYCHFRLNGCLTIANLVLHPGRRGLSEPTQCTGGTLSEPSERVEGATPLVDQALLEKSPWLDAVAEGKAGRCD